MLTNGLVVDKWLSMFAKDVPKEILANHVTKSGNFLWHIFSWGKAFCLDGGAAREALDSLAYDTSCIMFFGGCSENGEICIDDLSFCDNPSSAQLDELQEQLLFTKKDIYVVGKDFRWTYVLTHEMSCGPYFCYRS